MHYMETFDTDAYALIVECADFPLYDDPFGPCELECPVENKPFETIEAAGIPIVEFILTESASVRLVVRRSMRYNSSERIALTVD